MDFGREAEEAVAKAAPFTGWILRLGFLLCSLYVVVAVLVESLVGCTPKDSATLLTASTWLVPLMVLVIILLIALAVYSVLLSGTGSPSFSRYAAIGGMLILAGGIWADVLGAVSVTPDLALECNPFIVVLREFHAPGWAMYMVGFLAQLGITVISCAMWLSFLRHRRTYLEAVWAFDPRSLLQFVYVGLGGNLKLTASRPSSHSSPRSYRAVWWMVLCWIQPFARWLEGLYQAAAPKLNWLGIYLGAWAGFLAPIIMMAFVGLAFVSWLSYSYYSRPMATATHDCSTTR